MPNLTQFESDNPIIQDQPVASEATGLEAIGKVLGGVSHEAAQQAAAIGEEQSNAMYTQSQAHLDTIKTNAKIEMIKNQGHAAQIAQATAENYEQIVNQSVVNKGDRARLRLSASKDLNDIRLDAARTEVGVAKRTGAVTFFNNWPTVLSGIKSSVGDPKEFENRINSANQLISSMVLSEALTPKQGERAFQSLQHTMDAAGAYLEAAGNPNMTARDYHNVKGGLIPVDDGTHMGQPVDHNTLEMYETHSKDLTFDTLKADVAAGGAGNPAAWFELKDHQLNEITSFATGSRSVDTDLKAGMPFAQLTADLERYKAKGQLSTFEDGRKARIQNVLSDMGAGNFGKVMGQNPLYREAEFQYNQSISAVKNNPNLDAAQRGGLIRSYDNDLAWKKVSLAESMHVPDELTNPIDPGFAHASKAAWGLNADPSALTTRVDYLYPELREYFARNQGTPVQQETTRVVGNIKDAKALSKGGNTLYGQMFGFNYPITEQDRSELVMANQTGRDFSNLKTGDKGAGDEGLRKDMQKNLYPAISFIARQKGGESRTVAIVDMATNYVKFLAQKNGDLDMKNRQEYMNKATGVINAAYPLITGTNWKINAKDIPQAQGVDNWQLDTISNYLLQDVKQQLQVGNDRASINAQIDMNSLSVVSRPTGHLAVIDAYGHTLGETRYNGRLLHYALHQMSPTNSQLASVIPQKGTEKGMLTAGNIDLSNRPVVKNEDSSQSTVRTITIEEDGKTILLPTVIDGKIVSNKKAVEHYRETGQHMGVFSSEAAANEYDKKLHKEKGWEGQANKWDNKSPEEMIDSNTEMVDDQVDAIEKKGEELKKKGDKQGKKLKALMEREKSKRGNK